MVDPSSFRINGYHIFCDINLKVQYPSCSTLNNKLPLNKHLANGQFEVGSFKYDQGIFEAVSLHESNLGDLSLRM